MFLSVLAHGAVGSLDEILMIVLPLMFVLLMAIAWWYTRRQPPVLEDSDAEER